MGSGTSGGLVKLTTQFEPDTVKRLDHVAKARHTSRAAIVRDLVHRVLPVAEAENGIVRPAEPVAV